MASALLLPLSTSKTSQATQRTSWLSGSQKASLNRAQVVHKQPHNASRLICRAQAANATGEVSAKVVKELREATGAGMMDCKKALVENNGDLEAATAYLRKKGLAGADKKAGRIASEGLIGSYIHAGAQLGVIVEVNCETDFVARNPKFQELVKNIAMQVAACPAVRYVKKEDVPQDFIESEREMEMAKEDLASKKEEIRAKIVEGRLSKRAAEVSLLEQQYIRDNSISVAEYVKQVVAELGENIQVRRFTRYVLGEGIEKKVSNLAEEVAAQTGGKA
eukprot:jgi/Chlat1/1459/Chrsp12S02010